MSDTKTRDADVIDRLLTAYNADGVEAIADDLFTPDVRWHFGFGPFRDAIEGPQAVAAMLTAMRASTANGRVETVSRLTGDRFAINFTRFTSDGGSLELADAFRLVDGRIAEYWTLPEDVALANQLSGLDL